MGTGLRIWSAAALPLTGDEALTWRTALEPPARFLLWSHHSDHPPLSFALARLSLEAFGRSAWALRLPSLAAGVLGIVAAWGLGRSIGSAAQGGAAWMSAPIPGSPAVEGPPEAAGLVLAALVAFDPVLVVHSALARMYALLALLVLLTLARFHDLLIRDERRLGPWFLLGALVAAAGWTHTLGFLLVPAIAAGALWTRRGGGGGGRAVIAALSVPAVAALPLVARGIRAAAPAAGASGETELGAVAAVRFTLWNAAHPWGLGPFGPAFVALAIAGLYVLARRSPALGVAAAAMAALALVATAVGVADRTFGVDRYLVPWRLGLGAGLAALVLLRRRAARGIAAAAVAAACLAGAWASLPRGLPEPFGPAAMAAAIAPAGPDEKVAFAAPYLSPLGRWYGLLVDDPRGEGWPRRPDGTLPARVWLIGGTAGSEAGTAPGLGARRAVFRGAGSRLTDLVDRLEAAYGVRVDRARLEEALRRHGVVAIAFTPRGARIVVPRPRTLAGRDVSRR